MSEEQHNLFEDTDYNELLNHLPEVELTEELAAIAAFEEHLWALVLITEKRLKKHLSNEEARLTSAQMIADIAHYQGGRCRYLPRGDKLKKALRDIHIFDLWKNKLWPIDRIKSEFCPTLSDVAIYAIIRRKKAQHISRVQAELFPGL